MIEMLEKQLALTRTATRISVLKEMYSKRLSSEDNMATYNDEFETLFLQLKRMGTDTRISETHKTTLLLTRLGKSSPLESTAAVLKTLDFDQLTRDAVTFDVIQEWTQLKLQVGDSEVNTGSHNNISNANDEHHGSRFKRKHSYYKPERGRPRSSVRSVGAKDTKNLIDFTIRTQKSAPFRQMLGKA